jgi:hypothetical protein
MLTQATSVAGQEYGGLRLVCDKHCEQGGKYPSIPINLWLYVSAGGAARMGQQHARPVKFLCVVLRRVDLFRPQGELHVWGSNTRGQLAKKDDHA